MRLRRAWKGGRAMMESASAVGALASEQPIDLPHASTLQNYEAAFLKHVIEGEKRSEARSSPCRHRQRANSVALKRARWPLLRSSLMRRNVHVLLRSEEHTSELQS